MSLMTQEDFGKGVRVNVKRHDADPFPKNFTGTVINWYRELVTVEDDDGNTYDCSPDQLSYNSDEWANDEV